MTTDVPLIEKHHVLPTDHFTQLSTGFGGPDVIRLLWRTQRSRRLLLIKTLFDEATRQPDLLGPLPTAVDAWDTLLSAQAAAPDAVESILLHPQVGTWAAHTVRRERGGVPGPEPLWVDFGQVHTLALVAAARAGTPWRATVPLRSGRVMLPTLGMAIFAPAQPWGVADVETEGGRIAVRYGETVVAVPVESDVDCPGWWRLRRIRVGSGPTLDVFLDDVDPFRDFADPTPPARLDEAAYERWRTLVDDAWRLLCRDQPDVAEAMAVGVVSLVPLPAGDGAETRSGSTGEAFGMVMSSEPREAARMAETLVHEFHHIKLGGLTHLVQLTDDDPTPRYYAPWRDDPRPIGGYLQGIYAFTAIAAFWREHRRHTSGMAARLADFEYAYARGQAYQALEAVRDSPSLTALGTTFIDGLVEQVRPWMSESLPAEIVAAAGLVHDGHRLGWRIRNLRPDPDEVRALAEAWIAGGPAPGLASPPTVEERPETRWSLGRLGFVRLRLAEPDDWRGIASLSTGAGWAANLTEADVALVAGELIAARDGFLARIAADRDDLDAWTGLALATGAADRAAFTWLAHPELVYGVYKQCLARQVTPSPVELAAWIRATPVRFATAASGQPAVAAQPGYRREVRNDQVHG